MDTTVWWFMIAFWTICGGLGALISMQRDRHPAPGFILGFGLSFIGLFIVCVLPRGVLNLGPGRYAVRCPVCNAVQNVADSDNSYKCWQCHQPTVLHTVDDPDAQGRHTVECPICAKKSKLLGQGIRYTCSCGSRNNLAIYI